MIDCRPAINMSVLKRRGGGISRVTKKEGPFAESTMQKGQIINFGWKFLLYHSITEQGSKYNWQKMNFDLFYSTSLPSIIKRGGPNQVPFRSRLKYAHLNISFAA